MPQKSEAQMLWKINKNLTKLTSVRHSFLRGVAVGLGSALGATLVLTLLIAFLVRVLQTAERIPYLGGVVDRVNIEEIIPPSPKN